MRILAIETSCDETSIAILEADKKGGFKILSNIISSQVKIHAPFGGVVPTLAKREHQKNLVPILTQALKKASLLIPLRHPESPKGDEGSPAYAGQISPDKLGDSSARLRSTQNDTILSCILACEPELFKKLLPFLKKYEKPKIDLIAVTNGPGLEPALWVGVNFAKALGYFWNLPVMPVNHVEAHIIANWLPQNTKSLLPSLLQREELPPLKKEGWGGFSPLSPIAFPTISLVVSGGHTQLVLMRDFGKYKILGETRDDAAGEAFDKLAKMLNLGYPGGPIVAELASLHKSGHKFSRMNISDIRGKSVNINDLRLPRPMINSNDYDFSFSGLKTAALYFIKTLTPQQLKKLTPAICAEFQQAAIDVLVAKTIHAAAQLSWVKAPLSGAKEFKIKSVLLSGGVAANDLLRKTLKKEAEKNGLLFHTPPKEFCTDNAAMIALIAFFKTKNQIPKTKNYNWQKIQVDANLRLV